MLLDMELNTFQNPLAPGLLLISKPEAGDPRFLNSVSLLCLHDEQGSLALILNHPLPLFIDSHDLSVSDQKENENSYPLFRGGPVGDEQCFFLMISETQPEGSEKINENLYLGAQKETLSDFSYKVGLKRGNIRFFIGYAGWSYFQLDCEASNGWWFTLPKTDPSIFQKPVESLWLSSLEKLGPDFEKKGREFLDSDLFS
jgi:putative transcriptional regulator